MGARRQMIALLLSKRDASPPIEIPDPGLTRLGSVFDSKRRSSMARETWGLCDACDRWFFCDSWRWTDQLDSPITCPICGSQPAHIESLPKGVYVHDVIKGYGPYRPRHRISCS